MLPEGFLKKMEAILGDELPSFRDALLNSPPVRGVRANAIKPTVGGISDLGMPTRKLPYLDNGYVLDTDEPVGAHPMHHAGAIYMQDPGAMAALAAINIEPDWKCLDLCAAPGGKSSQIAERLGSEGYLHSNEFVPKRAKILVGNLERLGVRGAIVTSLDTARIAELYRAYFDLVVCDAPCSGEGMFRKSEEALRDWSENTVLECAKRQSEILDNAAPTVKVGGYLLYSTCTWSCEEDELTVTAFLDRHPQFQLVPVREELRLATSDGLSHLSQKYDLSLTRRCYVHKMAGEGQFIALMQRKDGAEMPTLLYKDASLPLTRAENKIAESFLSENMAQRPSGELKRVGNSLVILPHGISVPPRSVFSSGVLLGEIRGENLFPSHHFISAYGCEMKRKVELSYDEAMEYLSGLELSYSGAERGWCALTYRGAVLGGGKISDGKIKNHYPKGLRTR